VSSVSDDVYVIHCKRLVERRSFLEDALKALGWEARWIISSDPGEIPRRHLLHFKRRARLLTIGEISVYLKHLEALRRIAWRNATGFVIEDDAIFPPEFRETFARYRSALTRPFDVVFFGACYAADDPGSVEGSLFAERSSTRSMSGYLATPAAAGRLLAHLEERPILEPIDHAVNRILNAGGFTVLWSQPPLLLNGTETGRFGHSLGIAWRERAGRPNLGRRIKPVMDRLVAAISAPRRPR
jgi:GR25 family glycosyltransferase involved in LPS biosynthesis